MATRESQGLQVALILFVMVTVVLAVTSYFFFREAEERTAQAVAAREEAERFDRAAKQLDYENQLLKHVLGVEPKTEAELDSLQRGLRGNKDMEVVLNRFHRDMDVYAAGFTGQPLNYQTLQAHLVDQANRRDAQLADADGTVKGLLAERESVQQAEARRTAKAEAALVQLQQDRNAEKQELAAYREQIDDKAKKTAALLPQKLGEIRRLTDEMSTAIAEREAQVRHWRELYLALKKKYDDILVDKTPEHPDGEIVHVNYRAKVVWINLGSADGLERAMYFGVYDPHHAIDAINAKAKARIQVTAIKEPHLAEARILYDELTNPIVKTDKIYSPIFRKGQKMRVALAGLLDIDGDGKSDQAKVKSIITTNGGVVDAELLADGSIAGAITLETRFLVTGGAPTDKTDEALIRGWNSMQEEAARKGLETMSLHELLDRMGYQDDARVVNLQRGGPDASGTTKQPRTESQSSVFPRAGNQLALSASCWR